jgi:hypothetical protein
MPGVPNEKKPSTRTVFFIEPAGAYLAAATM